MTSKRVMGLGFAVVTAALAAMLSWSTPAHADEWCAWVYAGPFAVAGTVDQTACVPAP